MNGEMSTPSGQQPRRRSARLSSPPTSCGAERAVPTAAVKRSITVRKIVPRKTAAPSDNNKENVHRLSADHLGKKPKVSTPDPAQPPRGKKPTMPSPILASSPPPPPPPRVSEDPADSAWSKKVRRSYSRLSDQSVNSPDGRETLFGFEKLQTPEVVRRVGLSKSGADVSGSLSGLSSFATLLDGDGDDAPSVPERPDLNIPGVVVEVKRRRRRRKVQEIGGTELDSLAAKMNAEFEEAEGFELIVE